MSFVLCRVTSWIVSGPGENGDDPRNHTKLRELTYVQSEPDLWSSQSRYELRIVIQRAPGI